MDSPEDESWKWQIVIVSGVEPWHMWMLEYSSDDFNSSDEYQESNFY